jgi:hypothetical protein
MKCSKRSRCVFGDRYIDLIDYPVQKKGRSKATLLALLITTTNQILLRPLAPNILVGHTLRISKS